MDARPIPSAPGYLASRCGQIISQRGYEERTLKAGKHSAGYRHVNVKRTDGSFRTCLIHRLVLEAWVGPCPDGAVTNHKNGDKADNRLENLEYCSQSENMAHAYRTGLSPKPPTRRGKNAPKAKLCEQEVLALRELAAIGTTIKELASAFGITPSTASKIVLRHTWKHLPQN